MPKHYAHHYATELMFGRSFPLVDKAIDMPAEFLGKGHRRLFHTFKDAYLVGSVVCPDPRGGVAGCFHVLLDKLCSKDKNFRKWLQFSAKMDATRKKEMRQWWKLMQRGR